MNRTQDLTKGLCREGAQEKGAEMRRARLLSKCIPLQVRAPLTARRDDFGRGNVLAEDGLRATRIRERFGEGGVDETAVLST